MSAKAPSHSPSGERPEEPLSLRARSPGKDRGRADREVYGGEHSDGGARPRELLEDRDGGPCVAVGAAPLGGSREPEETLLGEPVDDLFGDPVLPVDPFRQRFDERTANAWARSRQPCASAGCSLPMA